MELSSGNAYDFSITGYQRLANFMNERAVKNEPVLIPEGHFDESLLSQILKSKLLSVWQQLFYGISNRFLSLKLPTKILSAGLLYINSKAVKKLTKCFYKIKLL
ncbi:hypothetical protein OfM1_17540 [Lactovum odontotermitis]